jgi:maltose alpha-D-glucosyltransferase/alpha-amylase
MWYKQAVFYQVSVRAFKDSDGDGHGDLRGVIEGLDYLETLGVDCVWLMPIYASPLRDDGYDVADYRGIAEPLAP